MDAEIPADQFPWEIHREGRAWSPEQWSRRRERTPNKNELINGRLYWTEEDRLNMLALLLENVGLDRAVRFGDPQLWRDAIAALGDEST